MKKDLRRVTRWVSTILAMILAAALFVLVAACGGASSSSEGADEAESSRQDRGTARDLSICPNECFLDEGGCFSAPAGDPEEMRGDEVRVLEPEPCDPRCCEGG